MDRSRPKTGAPKGKEGEESLWAGRKEEGKEERGKHFPSLFGYTCSGGVGSTNRLLVLVGRVKRGTQEGVRRKTRRGSLLFCRSLTKL